MLWEGKNIDTSSVLSAAVQCSATILDAESLQLNKHPVHSAALQNKQGLCNKNKLKRIDYYKNVFAGLI